MKFIIIFRFITVSYRCVIYLLIGLGFRVSDQHRLEHLLVVRRPLANGELEEEKDKIERRRRMETKKYDDLMFEDIKKQTTKQKQMAKK